MNDRLTIFEQGLVTVWCHPALGIIQHEMRGFVYGDLFRAALTHGARAMREHKGSKWLSDERLNSALPPEDLTWVTDVWYPEAQSAGWKTWALLPPEDIFGKMNIKRHIKAHQERGINVNVFDNPDAALAWLKSA
jgi:hypothetical protein